MDGVDDSSSPPSGGAAGGDEDAMIASTPADATDDGADDMTAASVASVASVAKGPPLCEECETSDIIWDCDVCQMGLCDMCFDVLHRKGKRAQHGKRARNGGGGGGDGSTSVQAPAPPSSSGSSTSSASSATTSGGSPPKGRSLPIVRVVTIGSSPFSLYVIPQYESLHRRLYLP